MSEKRFLLDKLEKGNAILSVKITDSVKDDDYFIMTKEAYEDDIDEIVSLLNEQEDSMAELRNILFAKEKTIDRLENTLLHLTEADGYLEKNRKITELADIEYNVKMVLSNDEEQLAKVINEQQAEIERLKKELDEKCP